MPTRHFYFIIAVAAANIATGKKIFLMFNLKLPTYTVMNRNIFAAFILWLISFILLLAGFNERELLIVSGIIVPGCILFFTLSFYSLLPKAGKKKQPFLSYILIVLLMLLIAAVPLYFLTNLYVRIQDHAFSFTVLNLSLQLFIMSPVSWYFYQRHHKRNEQVLTLQKELDQSAATLHFLRSQINPHFLFNALNTIYGTALQEQAARTSEAVQTLGDMMRFMMHDNLQEKIQLSKEIEYLNNYISLQKLRIGSNPLFTIETEIEEPAVPVSIAPMLLIPFIENAFKHGISSRQGSYIKVTLKVEDNVLYFDVSNSLHPKQQGDTEKDNNGIGLSNVQQRLQLLYNHKHQLDISKTGKDFFVHLTITLS